MTNTTTAGVPALIACTACDKQISVQAPACPGCGAPNEWVHPRIATLVAEKDNTDITEPFKFKYSKFKISGNTEKKLPRGVQTTAIVITALLVMVLGFFGSFGLLFGPIGIVGGIVIGGGVGLLLAVLSKSKTFDADFEAGTWKSNDDEFWAPVRKMLFP